MNNNIWDLPEMPMPDKINNLINKKYWSRYTIEKNGDKVLILAKLTYVSIRIDDADLLMSNDDLSVRILNPCIDVLERNSKK